MQIPVFISDFIELTKSTIIELESGDYPDGDAKKAKLDEILSLWTIGALTNLSVPFWAKFGIKFIINKYLPVLTQKIYDLIKVRVAGITESTATA